MTITMPFNTLTREAIRHGVNIACFSSEKARQLSRTAVNVADVVAVQNGSECEVHGATMAGQLFLSLLRAGG